MVRAVVLLLLVLLLLVLLAPEAQADVVPPAPEDCPPGSVGSTDHYGPHCRPSICRSDEDCKDGQRCRELALCVFEKTYEHWRGNTHRREVRGSCAQGEACPEESSCETAKRCVPAGDVPPEPSASSPASPASPPPSASSLASPPTTPSPKGAAGPSTRCGACVLVGAGGPAGHAAWAIAIASLALVARRRRHQSSGCSGRTR